MAAEGLQAFSVFGDISLRGGDQVMGAMSGMAAKAAAFFTSPIGIATATIAAIVGIGVVAVKSAGEIEAAENKIRVATGATGTALDDLKQSFKNVAGKTAADFDTVSAAISGVHVRTGLVGPPLEELALKFVKLSRITKTDVADNIRLITRLFGDWSISSDKQGGAMDHLLKVSQATGIGIGDLSQTVVQFGAPLRMLGFTFEESTTMLGKWEREGVNVTLALTGMKFALKTFGKEGIDAQVGLKKAFDEIKNAKTPAEATALAFKTFGMRAGPDLAAAIREGRFDFTDLMAQIQKSPETIDNAAAEVSTLAGKFGILTNNVKLALEPLGKGILDALNGMGAAINAKIPAMQKAWDGFAKSLKDTWDKVLTGFKMPDMVTTDPFAKIGQFLRDTYEVVKGVLGPMVEVFKKSWADMQKDLGPALKELSKGFEAMKPLLMAFAQLIGVVIVTAIGIVVGVINGLVGMIAPLVSAFGGLMDIVGGVSTGMHALFGGDWSGFVDGMKVAIDGVVALFAGIYGAVVGFLAGFVDGVIVFFTSLYDSLVGHSIVPDMINGIVEWFAGLPGKVMAFVADLVAKAIAAVTSWKDQFIAKVAELSAGVSAAWTALQTWLGGLWTTIAATFLAWGNTLLATAKAAWESITTTLSTAWESIRTLVEYALAKVLAFIAYQWEHLKYITSSAWDALKAFLSGSWESIKATAFAALVALGTWVLEKWEAIKASTTAAWNAVTAALSSAWESIKTAASAALAAVVGYVTDKWNAAKSTTSAVWAAIDAAIDAVWSSIKSSASAALAAVLGYIDDKWSAAKSATSSAWAAIKSALDAAWSSMKTAVSAGITAVVGFVQGIPGKVTSALGNMSSLLKGAGKSILDGLLNGMKAAWTAAASWLSGLGSKIKSLKGPLDYDAQLLTDQGAAIIDGLGRGMQGAWPGIASTLSGYTSEIGGMSVTLPTARPMSVAGLGSPLGTSGSLVLNLTIDLGDRIAEVSRTITGDDVRDGTFQARLVPLRG